MATPKELVFDDVDAVLRAALTGFEFETPSFGDRDPVDELVGGDTGLVAVPWQASGTVAPGGPLALPVGRHLVVRGVTLVDVSLEEPRFYRFIDWSTALFEAGVAVALRPVDMVNPPD